MKLFLPCLILSLILTLVASIMKILHWAGAPLVLDLAFVFGLIFIVIGLSDLWRKKDKSVSEKLLWTLGFLFLGWIIGIIYYNKEYRLPANRTKK